MQKTNLLVMSMLATLLLSCGFVALATADEGISEATVSPPPDLPPVPDAPTPLPRDTSNNSTNDDEQIYHILSENETEPLIGPNPNGGEGNLIATDTGAGNTDLTLPLTIIGTVLAVAVGGAVGMVLYRKHEAKTPS